MYEDKTLVCKDCGNEFVFTAGEQEFYAEKGLQTSHRDARNAVTKESMLHVNITTLFAHLAAKHARFRLLQAVTALFIAANASQKCRKNNFNIKLYLHKQSCFITALFYFIKINRHSPYLSITLHN